jgi:hypothetical protein
MFAQLVNEAESLIKGGAAFINLIVTFFVQIVEGFGHLVRVLGG